MTLKDTLHTLAEAITKKPPFCSGTLPISSDAATLFYKKAEGETHAARWINLLNASNDELESLAEACQPATFGLGNQDVYDESYRKAGKMDLEQFSSKLDVNTGGIVDRIHLQLLEGLYEELIVRAELYKLNVYGKDSFFKSHKDTPQSDRMFGSLVIVFPTPHEGGALVLRHDNREWTFDSAALTRQANEPSIAYIAFYSDVDHEVTRVQSGHRVTLTYNLFFEQETTRQKLANLNVIKPITFDNHTLRDALSAALADPSFLPEGGYLGFGLSFVYPIDGLRGKNNSVLKGSDAMIYRVCRKLSLSPALSAVYKYSKRVNVLVPAHRLLKSCTVNDNAPGGGLLSVLLNKHNGRIIREIREGEEGGAQAQNPPQQRGWGGSDLDNLDDKDNYINIAWVTPMQTFNKFFTSYVDQWALGNEAGTVYIYAKLCIAVKVGPFGDRETDKQAKEKTAKEATSS